MTATFGRFSDNGRSFLITDFATPRPWHNYLFNNIYLANITQHATGGSFNQSREEGLRVNITEDKDGEGGPRFTYLRDNDTGQYWSLTGAPNFSPMQDWSCEVGLGYQINRSKQHDIEASWRMFVPSGNDPCELWTFKLTNHSDKPRSISLIPYVEMHMTGGSTLMDFIAVLQGHYDAKRRAVFGINNCVKFPDTFKAFLASDSEVAGATVSRDAFLGHYHTYCNPLAVELGNVHNDHAGTEWLGASLRHEVKLQPGESATINCMLGQICQVDDADPLIEKYLSPGQVQAAFDKHLAEADAMVARTAVTTGDSQFDRWANVWLKQQLKFVGRWGRVIGRGYRDVLQDSFAHRLTEPTLARDCLVEVFSKQYPSGKAIRAWRLPHALLDTQDYSDSPSWMIMALSMYLKETGDLDFLSESVPFLNASDPYAASTESGSVFEHVKRAMQHLTTDLGPHGLVKIHYGDWCDTMNGVGGKNDTGQSVMLSMQVVWGCKLLGELCNYLAKIGKVPEGEDLASLQELALVMTEAGEKLTEAINSKAWDGAWYARAFDDNGQAVGVSNGPAEDMGELRIFLNPQSWCVISGVAVKDRAKQALASACEQLDTGYGMVLSYPQSTFLKPRLGQMSAMTPGFYENGSVYTHGNCFWAAALAIAGDGEAAWQAVKTMLPDTPNKPNYDGEPFAIPNMYIGPVVERRKQQSLYLSGWRTGSAAWLYLILVEYVLGLRAEYQGLRVDPKLPKGMMDVTVERVYRGDIYKVRIMRATNDASKVESITLDGQPVEDDSIPAVGDGGTHEVVVKLA